jgi:hypothetical protein
MSDIGKRACFNFSPCKIKNLIWQKKNDLYPCKNFKKFKMVHQFNFLLTCAKFDGITHVDWTRLKCLNIILVPANSTCFDFSLYKKQKIGLYPCKI